MARLIILYDKDAKVHTDTLPTDIKQAKVDVKDDLTSEELEAIISLLAELLLEQFTNVS